MHKSMFIEKSVLGIISALNATITFGQQEALWLRDPAISPDAKSIVFGYKGNFKVPTSKVRGS